MFEKQLDQIDPRAIVKYVKARPDLASEICTLEHVPTDADPTDPLVELSSWLSFDSGGARLSASDVHTAEETAKSVRDILRAERLRTLNDLKDIAQALLNPQASTTTDPDLVELADRS